MPKRRRISRYWSEFIPKSFICFFRENYTSNSFRKDCIAGITVGIVALPLAMAFAIASGLPPERGLYTAIVAGFLISMLGGSRVQIGGPTGAFVVIVYDIVQREGYAGLALATIMAAILLLIMGFSRLGTLIKFIPYPLVTGFTTGIAVIIFSSQVKDFLGLNLVNVPSDFLSKWQAFFKAMATWDPWTVGVSTGTLLTIIFIRRFTPYIPWGITAIVLCTLVCWAGDIPIVTIADRYGNLPRTIPLPSLPEMSFGFQTFKHLVPDAITIALLAGIESLLSAVVADGMTGRRHKSNCELVAQGFANLGSVFFGGIPATGAIARTATNIKSGAMTPIAGMVHAVTLFLIILAFAPIVSLIPLPALSAVLVMVAWNMSEVDRFRHLFKAPIGDVAVLLTTFFLTVLVDLTVAVEVGMILAAFLFMKRMSDLSKVVPLTKLFKEPQAEKYERGDRDAISKKKIPPGVEVYEINGPFFFGVADSLQSVLENVESKPKVFILRMRNVPTIDATGLHALEEFSQRCKKREITLLLSGVSHPLLEAFINFGIDKKIGKKNIFPHIDDALDHAGTLKK